MTVVLRLGAGTPPSLMRPLRNVVERFPGGHSVVLEVGDRRVHLSAEFRVDPSADCLAALGEFGTVSSK